MKKRLVVTPAEEPWRQEAACRMHSPSVMYPMPADESAIGRAKAICGGCVSKEDCLHAGLREQHGVWGGLTEDERIRLWRRMRRVEYRDRDLRLEMELVSQ